MKEFPIIETARLMLRQPVISDSEEYHQLLSLDAVTRFTNIPQSPARKRSERYVSWMSKLLSRGNGCAWIIERRTSNEMIGAIRINEIHRKASYGEVGYELDPEFWNQGLMTEALTAITQIGHREFKLNRMEAWVIPGNIASETVLTKNGYVYEGTLRQRLYLRGEFSDTRMYSHLIQDA